MPDAGLDVFEFGDYPLPELLTMDNVVLEIITWKQLGLYPNPIVILNVNHYILSGRAMKDTTLLQLIRYALLFLAFC